MKFDFIDTFVSRIDRYSLGYERTTGEFFLEFPVFNRYVEYGEYYRISQEEYDLFLNNTEILRNFLKRCYAHLEDDRMIFFPPADIRGTP